MSSSQAPPALPGWGCSAFELFRYVRIRAGGREKLLEKTDPRAREAFYGSPGLPLVEVRCKASKGNRRCREWVGELLDTRPDPLLMVGCSLHDPAASNESWYAGRKVREFFGAFPLLLDDDIEAVALRCPRHGEAWVEISQLERLGGQARRTAKTRGLEVFPRKNSRPNP